jgi:hypothetical protein
MFILFLDLFSAASLAYMHSPTTELKPVFIFPAISGQITQFYPKICHKYLNS